MNHRIAKLCFSLIFTAAVLLVSGCSQKTNDITHLTQLSDKVFAVPTGTLADKLVLSRFPQAKFIYFNTVLDTAMAVKFGKADAAAYDEPIMKNIAAKQGGLLLLPDMITVDSYAFAVRLDAPELKRDIDSMIDELKANGIYSDMEKRWFPKTGAPAAMPNIPLAENLPVLRLGTSAITEPFSFIDGTQNVVGFDIELARRIAQKKGMNLQVVDMDFGAMIPALNAGKVDMIAACITVSEDRAKKVLFSKDYYVGGIAALVRAPTVKK